MRPKTNVDGVEVESAIRESMGRRYLSLRIVQSMRLDDVDLDCASEALARAVGFGEQGRTNVKWCTRFVGIMPPAHSPSQGPQEERVVWLHPSILEDTVRTRAELIDRAAIGTLEIRLSCWEEDG